MLTDSTPHNGGTCKITRVGLVHDRYLSSVDDTGMPVRDRAHARGIKRGHIWTYLGDGGEVAFCEYTPDWKGSWPQATLADFRGQVIQSDGYAGLAPCSRVLMARATRAVWTIAAGVLSKPLDAGAAGAAVVLWGSDLGMVGCSLLRVPQGPTVSTNVEASLNARKRHQLAPE